MAVQPKTGNTMHIPKNFIFCAGLGLLAMLYTPQVQAQTAGTTAGFKGGINWTNLRASGQDISDENARLGIHAGLFGRTALSDGLSLQAELLYSGRGSTIEYNGLLFDQSISFNTAYLDVPLLLAIRLGDVLELHGGGYFGYLLSSNVSTSGDLGSASEDLDRDNFNSMDYGLLGGVGVNLGPAQIGVRYIYGLAEVAKSDGARLFLGDARNSTAQLYLAIGLGGR